MPGVRQPRGSESAGPARSLGSLTPDATRLGAPPSGSPVPPWVSARLVSAIGRFQCTLADGSRDPACGHRRLRHFGGDGWLKTLPIVGGPSEGTTLRGEPAYTMVHPDGFATPWFVSGCGRNDGALRNASQGSVLRVGATRQDWK